MQFIHFITKNPLNKKYALAAMGITVLQFVLFKILYPYADFFSDSYSYIYAAHAHLDINIWPIGYSKFLGLFHHLTHSDTALVAFQYFFLELASLYFFFTVLYFFRLSRTNTIVLFIFLFCNPLFLYLSNYINSDPLFASLSLIWFTELLWIIHRPRMYQLFTQAIILFLAFTVRNNAYYYPIIAAVALLLSKNKPGVKLAGIIMPLFLIVPFILYSRQAAKKITGTAQFSLFTGWQLANNALYMYHYLPVDSTLFHTAETKELNRLSQRFYSQSGTDFGSILTDYTANFFIREPKAPLKQYFNHHYAPKNTLASIADWGKASTVFNEFGSSLIKHYPISYAQHFMLLNAKNYFLPPLEKLELYNLGMDSVWPIAKLWFDYPSTKIRSPPKTLQGSILVFYPAFFLILNIMFFIFLFRLLLIKKINLITEYKHPLILLSSLWILNGGFCIFATINVFRYQFFPLIILTTAAIIIFEDTNKLKERHIIRNSEFNIKHSDL